MMMPMMMSLNENDQSKTFYYVLNHVHDIHLRGYLCNSSFFPLVLDFHGCCCDAVHYFGSRWNSTLNGTYFCFDIQNYRYGRKQNWETDSYSA